MTATPRILAGSANPALAGAIAAELGVALTDCVTERFPDGESHVALRESVRGADVYVVQPTGPPVDAHVVELALMADACRRADAARVTAVMPYFGYARQDRRSAGGEAVPIPVIADMLAGAGVGRVLVVDPHTPALEAMVGVPLESVSALPLLREAVARDIPDEAVVVAPDLGATKIAERLAAPLGLPTAFVAKTRVSGTAVETTGIVGDVSGCAPVIIDDMVSTGGTIEAAAEALSEAGCQEPLVVAATHGLLVGGAVERLAALPLRRVVLSDSLPVAMPSSVPCETESLAGLLATTIRRLHHDEPLEDLASHG